VPARERRPGPPVLRPAQPLRLRDLLARNQHASGVTFKLRDDPRITHIGRWLRIIRENEPLAAALGIDVVSAKSRVLALSGAAAALAGGFHASDISFVGPDQLLPFQTFLALTMIVIGGLGRIAGAVVGAVVVEAIYDGTRYFHDFLGLASDQIAALRILLVGAILLGFLLLRPKGIVADQPRRVRV